MVPHAASHPATQGLEEGRLIAGQYRLRRCVGVGGAAQTWRAVPRQGGPDLALKIVTDEPGSARRAQALLHEASLLHRLQHPHVVRYLGVVSLPGEGTTCLLMEWVPGGNLSEWSYAHGPCSAVDASVMALQLVEALEYLHLQGVVHRDLKPANILVSERGGLLPHLIVADFGISRPTSGGARCFGGGTPGYTAPEARAGAATTSADLYSLGAVLWTLIFGTEPRPNEGTAPQSTPGVGPVSDAGLAGLARLAVDLLSVDPKARPTLAQARVRLLDPTRVPQSDKGQAGVTLPPLLAEDTLQPSTRRAGAIWVKGRRVRRPTQAPRLQMLPLLATVLLSAAVAALVSLLPAVLTSG